MLKSVNIFMQIDLTKKAEKVEQDVNVEYTKQIITALKEKVKDHNATNETRVSFSQLKSIFISGARIKDENRSLNESGLARVNMFLRLSNVETLIHEFKETSAMDRSYRVISKPMFDFSQFLIPKEVDFIKAKEDIKKFNLDFNYNSIDDLYFEQIKQINYREYL
jgi:hypothetical protein